MMNPDSQQADFLNARSAVRERFKQLSKVINEARAAFKRSMRDGTSHRFDFASYPCFLDRGWQNETTLLCMTLAHASGHLHADRLFSKMPGHSVLFTSLDDQETYLRNALDNNAKFSTLSPSLVASMQKVAFSPRPFTRSERVSIDQPEVCYA